MADDPAAPGEARTPEGAPEERSGGPSAARSVGTPPPGGQALASPARGGRPDDAAQGGTAGALDVLHHLSLRTKALVIYSEFTRGQMEPEELRRILEVLTPNPKEREETVRAVEEELRAAGCSVGEIVRLMSGLARSVGWEAPRRALASPARGGRPDDAASESARGAAPAARAPSAQEANVAVTRKVRSPNLMRFESYEFGASPAEPDVLSGDEDEPVEGEVIEESEEKVPEEPPEEGQPEEEQVREEEQLAEEQTGEAPADGEAPGGDAARLKFASGGESAQPAAKGLAAAGKGFAGMGARFAPWSPRRQVGGTGRPTVLVADDDGRARMMYHAKLAETGFDVIEAKDGVEAWNHIKGGAVQCAVMDMKMPGYHGLEILSRMVDANLIIPVVVVSAFDQLANEFVVATYPKLKFLTKPAPPERVVEAVNSFLRPGDRAET